MHVTPQLGFKVDCLGSRVGRRGRQTVNCQKTRRTERENSGRRLVEEDRDSREEGRWRLRRGLTCEEEREGQLVRRRRRRRSGQ